MNQYSINFTFLCLFILLLCLINIEVKAAPTLDSDNTFRIKSNYLSDGHNNIDERKISRIKSRGKRQFDFLIDADHEDGLGTNLMASASVNLFKNDNTRLDGTARYSQRFNELGGHGKAKMGGSLHFHHEY